MVKEVVGRSLSGVVDHVVLAGKVVEMMMDLEI